jgi:hypothetical protein
VDAPRDEGMALVFALVFIILASMLILPMLSYSRTVMVAAGDEHRKIEHISAATGGMRVALADPIELYKACAESGLHDEFAVQLAVPSVGIPVSVRCTTLSDATELSDSDVRIAMTTTTAGSVAPTGTLGDVYANSGAADPHAWWADTTTTSTGGKVFLPYLPTHNLSHPASSGYLMPAWAGTCRVFFPGTYLDPVTINDTTPTYFSSGVYYFENTVTFGAHANVVIGAGAVEGCTDDAQAAYYAVNAPASVSVSGIGGTFIFGGAGRLVVTDGGSVNAPNVQFNPRLVDPTDVGNAVSAGVSIISVNGAFLTSSSSSDLLEPGYIDVPKSLTETNPTDAAAPVDAASTGYKPSTLVQTSTADPTPIVSVNFTGFGSAIFFVPGYVAVPQGRIDVNIGAGAGAGKSIQLLGAVLTAKVTESGDPPAMPPACTETGQACLQLGFENRVVQKTFKITSKTLESAGSPYIVSVAIVQVNDYGEYAINSWVTND